MAKQIGAYRFEGTIDGICFYKMEGEYYARKQSSLTGRRFWKAACFEGSRRSCKRLSRGSQLAAMVYNRFRKQKGMYAVLKSKAIGLLKMNTSEEKVFKKLLKLAFQLQPRRRSFSKYMWPVIGNKQKAESLAPVFSISMLNDSGYTRKVYLSSA